MVQLIKTKYQSAFDFIEKENPKNVSEAKSIFGKHWSSGAKQATLIFLNERGQNRVQIFSVGNRRILITRNRDGTFASRKVIDLRGRK